MAFDIFTKEELALAYTITKVGVYILIITAVATTLIRIGLVYYSDGQAGIVSILEKQQDNVQDTVDTGSLKQTLDTQKNSQPLNPAITGELPQIIYVPTLGINANIQSPDTTSVSVLDDALSKGPVYYQGSGTPGNRNMLIFGHSTGFSIVHNQAYKVFNNIKLAKVGEYAYIKTSSGTYTYVIQSVKKMSKYSTYIQFNSDKALLTLSTCDSFGSKSDRWVMEAAYVGYKKN